MTAFSHFPLQKALYEVLTNDATLMGLITGVHDRAPDNADFPYVSIGDFTGTDWSTKTTSGMEYAISMHVWSREGGRAEASAIMERIYLLLHDVDMAVEDNELIMMRFTGSSITLQPDGWSHHGIMRFRVLLQAV